jgi:DNA polymerase-3 subunit beta
METYHVKTLCNRDYLLSAFGMVASVAPSRSPRAILQNLKLRADADDSILMASDLEVAITYRVLGIKVDHPGSAILSTQKVQSILRTSRDEELAIETSGDSLDIRGLHAEFHLPSEDPDLFPEVPDFTATAYHVIAAADLKRLIRRTIFATDVESTRYALGGVLVELTADSIAMIGTDGRRLAKAVAACEVEGEPATGGSPVIPVKALKLIDRNLDDDDPPVHIAISYTPYKSPADAEKHNARGTPVAAMIRTDRAVIYTRLVEGRFPRYQDVFPASHEIAVPMVVGALLGAVEEAAIMVSEESRGTDFTFGNGFLRLASQSADVGKSKVETPINYEGADVEITFDARYCAEFLKALDPAATITAELIDHKNAAVFRTEDGYAYVVMPLTRDR